MKRKSERYCIEDGIYGYRSRPERKKESYEDFRKRDEEEPSGPMGTRFYDKGDEE